MLLPTCVHCNQPVMNTIAILCDIVGNLRPLSTTSACIYLRVYFTNVLYRRRFLDFAYTVMNSFAILWDSGSYLRPLLTTWACINLHVQLRTITTNARYRKSYYYAFAKLDTVRPSGYC